MPRATVWSVAPADDDPALHELGLSIDGHAHLTRAKAVIVATGAQERPFPIPGWTLPGVMTAGAAQIMLKGSGLVPAGPTVLAGSGPLLYLLASQLARCRRVDHGAARYDAARSPVTRVSARRTIRCVAAISRRD